MIASVRLEQARSRVSSIGEWQREVFGLRRTAAARTHPSAAALGVLVDDGTEGAE